MISDYLLSTRNCQFVWRFLQYDRFFLRLSYFYLDKLTFFICCFHYFFTVDVLSCGKNMLFPLKLENRGFVHRETRFKNCVLPCLFKLFRNFNKDMIMHVYSFSNSWYLWVLKKTGYVAGFRYRASNLPKRLFSIHMHYYILFFCKLKKKKNCIQISTYI